MQRLLTTSEAAAELGLHPSTIRQWCDRGFLPHVRVGRNRRIPADAIERLLEQMLGKRKEAQNEQA